MDENEEDPEALMHGHVMRKLRQKDLTAAEFEVCRKYLNDRAGRHGSKAFTRGHVSPPEAKVSNWDGLGFDNVAVGLSNEGAGNTDAGDSTAG